MIYLSIIANKQYPVFVTQQSAEELKGETLDLLEHPVRAHCWSARWHNNPHHKTQGHL